MTNYNELVEYLKPRKFGMYGKLWTTFLVIVSLAGIIAYTKQLREGLAVTGMRDYAFWGVYISNFVFFVAISLVGSLMSAILTLSGVKWSTPLTRIAEIIAVGAIVMAGLVIIVDMGRPDRLLNLFFHGRLQSPIIWDVIVITTYLVISILLLFYPLLPDFAVLGDKLKDEKPRWARFYKRLAFNWKGTENQKKIHSRSIRTLTIMIVPVAFGIHTVTSWLFATTYRPGWNSTNFGPYFIAGAFVAGAGAVVAVMYVVRKAYKLENFITDKHFDMMGRLLVLLCLLYLYFNINEYLVPAYKMAEGEREHLGGLFTGHYAPLFWSAIIGGLVLPIFILLFKKGRKPLPVFIVGLIVVAGAWWKRFIIVTPTLLHPFMPIQGVPESWHSYFPTFTEWTITFGTLAMALLIITLLIRYLPIIPIHETAEERGLLENEKTA